MASTLSGKELSLLGSLLESFPSNPPPCITLLLRHAPASFDDLNHGRLAVAIYDCWQASIPVNAVSVADHLDKRNSPPLGQSTALFLMGAADQAIPIDLAELEAATVWKSFQQRRAKSVLGDALAAIESAPDKADSVLTTTTRALDSLKIESAGQFGANGHSSGILPEILETSAFMGKPISTPDELIRGVLHRGCKMSLGGSSKAYKSWSFLDIAVSVAHGLPYLGFPTVPSKVLYINFEVPAWACQKRLQAIADAKSIKLSRNKLYLWNLRGHAATFDMILPKIVERIGNDQFALVILDPIYKIYGSTDENSATDVALLLNAIESISSRTGAAVIFGAHFSKGNQAAKESIDRVSGSGVFARDPDTIVTFTRHEEENAFVAELVLRNHPPVAPFVVRWAFPLFTPDESLDPANIKQASGRKAEYSAEDLLRLLPTAGLESEDWCEMAEKKVGVSRRSFYRIRKELEESGRILRSEINGNWVPVRKQ